MLFTEENTTGYLFLLAFFGFLFCSVLLCCVFVYVCVCASLFDDTKPKNHLFNQNCWFNCVQRWNCSTQLAEDSSAAVFPPCVEEGPSLCASQGQDKAIDPTLKHLQRVLSIPQSTERLARSCTFGLEEQQDKVLQRRAQLCLWPPPMQAE